MPHLAQEMASILAARRARLPQVQDEINRWQELEKALRNLEGVVKDLHSYSQTPDSLRMGLLAFAPQESFHGIARVLDDLRVVQTRFSRPTINIGVSGQARMGKSTLLQSISGLADQQIPTGAGIPVTAVRSRIFHAPQHRRAVLTLHTFDSFRQELLAPYHGELGLPAAPATVEQFAAWRYPRSLDELTKEVQERSSSEIALRRVLQMQRALTSYQDLLSGGEKIIALDELRPYVSYPTNDEENQASPTRRYLAVRDVRIECPFPCQEVGALGIIDLPGLGDLGSNVECYHMAGLRNEVDLAFLVVRPVQTASYWSKRDSSTADLLDGARGAIRNRRDFVMIVCNSGGCNEELITTLLDDIRRNANGGEEGRNFKVLQVDAANPASVEADVLLPAMYHLAERLADMDADVLRDALEKSRGLEAKVATPLKDLDQALHGIGSMTVDVRESLDDHAEELRRDIAAALQDLVTRLQEKARLEKEDPDYMKSVSQAYEAITQWIQNGFGRGKEVWCRNALRSMKVDKNSTPTAASELNSIRVQISKRYASLDKFFEERITALCADASRALREHLGQLVPAAGGRENLEVFARLLEDASEPCRTLSEAVRNLLAVRLEYRTHLHPRIRQELDALNLQVRDPANDAPHAQIVVDINEEGAETLYTYIAQLAEQAAYQTRNALVAEALMPARILASVVEQFEDELIRSEHSAREFKRLARAYRDEIWPGVYQGIDEANARYARVVKSLRAVQGLLKHSWRGA